MGFDPTPEQQDAIDAFRRGHHIALEAGAGTGKTSTLKLLSAVVPNHADGRARTGLYMAYNASIAKEAAAEFPPNTVCQPDGTIVTTVVVEPTVGRPGTWGTKPIEDLEVGDRVVSWSHDQGNGGSVNKRGHRVIGVSRRNHQGELIRVTAGAHTSRYTPEHPCIVNMAGLAGKFVVYMMARGDFFKIGMASWDVNQNRYSGLAARIQQEDADAAWILSVHDTKAAALLHESLAQYEGNIPGWRFRDHDGAVLSDPWSWIKPNRDRAEAALSLLGRDIVRPFWVRGESLRFRRDLWRVTAACNLITGMRVFALADAEVLTVQKKFTKLASPSRVWADATVTREPYGGQVTSIEVETAHTYFADGILTHNCKTGHAHFMRGITPAQRSRLFDMPRQFGDQQARILGIAGKQRITTDVVYSPRQVARVALETVTRFARSADRAITIRHVPRQTRLEQYEAHQALAAVVLPYARKAWDDIMAPAGLLKWDHDYYRKAFHLEDRRLAGDFLFLDEAQDSNGVVIEIVKAHQRDGMRIVAVGDRQQSINGWMGAEDAMDQFGGTRLRLSKSFRFGPAIAAEANKWLHLLDADLRISGHEPVGSVVRPLRNEVPDAILCRKNATAIAEAMTLINDGVKVALVKQVGQQVERLAKSALQLKQTGETDHPELCAFTSWAQVQEYVEQDHGGSDLAVFVKLVDEHGADTILAAMQRLWPAENAQVTISTAHRSKGMEWDRVRIAGDFEPARDDEGRIIEPERDDMMLAYVAVTRAKKVLDLGGLYWIDQLVGAPRLRAIA